MKIMEVTMTGSAHAKRYLGTEFFAKIARIIRRVGDEYISTGKNSHFIIASRKE
jgi:predicted methyltransferase